MSTDLKILFFLLSFEQKIRLILLLFLMVIGMILELFSIALVIPFLTLISDISVLDRFGYISDGLDYVTERSGLSGILLITILFVTFSTLNALFRMALLWFNFSYIYLVGAELGERVFKTIVSQPLSFHTKHSSSVSLGATRKVDYVVDSIIKPSIQGLASAIFATGIIVLMVASAPGPTMIFCCIALIYYIVVSWQLKSILNRISSAIAKNETTRILIVQEALGSIRDVILGKKQFFFISRFAKENSELRFSQGRAAIISLAPRFFLEALGMSAIAVIAYFAVSDGVSILESLPILGLLAISAQKLLPLLQQIYISWSSINSSKHLLGEITEILHRSNLGPIDAHDSCEYDLFAGGDDSSGLDNQYPFINVKNLKYRYPGTKKYALNDISFSIFKGEFIGIVGETGSGKSTLVDLLMGLDFTYQGAIAINGVPLNQRSSSCWHNVLSHVPQSIYLLDATIAENIALAEKVDASNYARIVVAAKKAKLDDSVMQLESGYDTRVGEQGVKLSGGQRQRIAIARALYKNSDVLVFDEATSALDRRTEEILMRDIASLKGDATLLMISHRLSTLSLCDRVIELTNGKVSWTGNYDDLVKRN